MTLMLPALGIVNAHDRPHQNMLAVVYGETALKWSYVVPGKNRSQAHPIDDLSCFTPLHHFGIRYGMTSDGRLRLTRFSISIATTPEGHKRDWQGSSDVIVDVMQGVVSKVVAAVQLRHRGPVTRTNHKLSSVA